MDMNVVIPQAPEVLKDKQYHSNVSYVIPPPTLYILHYTVYLCIWSVVWLVFLTL